MAKAFLRRHLSLDHLVFYRAWMEGTFNLEELADRYLETGANMPAAKRTLTFVQDELVSAAKREGKHGQAKLLMIPRETLIRPRRKKSPQQPTIDVVGIDSFEQYKARIDPNDEFGVREMLEYYEDYVATEAQSASATVDKPTRAEIKKANDDGEERRTDRDTRLHLALLQLINDLAAIVTAEPQAGDDVRGWFDQSIALRLLPIGIENIGQLAGFINAKGRRWHRFVPKLGVTTCERLTGWIKKYEHSTGLVLTEFATTPRRKLPKLGRGEVYGELVNSQSGTTLSKVAIGNGMEFVADSPFFPIERGMYIPPSMLDGSQGRNRAAAEKNRTGAEDDWSAINRWLDTFNEISHHHTQRSYRKESERLLAWAIHFKNMPFSSLTPADIVEFKTFLANPLPHEFWVATRSFPRSNKDWRPFVWRKPPKSRRSNLDGTHADQIAGLSSDSIRLSMTVLNSMCNWLLSQHYLDYNPFSGLPKNRGSSEIDVGRSLTLAQWRFVMKTLDGLDPKSIQTARLRFTLHLAYATGLRLSELVQATTGDLRIEHLDEAIPDAMELRVLGKGQHLRSVPISSSLRREMASYFSKRKLAEHPMSCPADTPLIAKLYASGGTWAMTPSSLSKILVAFFEFIASKLPLGERSKADRDRFTQASAHWLRHTHGSHAVTHGASLVTIKDNLGHKSLTTTSIYVKTEKKQRFEQMEAFDRAVYESGEI